MRAALRAATQEQTVRNKNLWVFYTEDSFSGNAKWLFDYIQAERPDITAYWMCASHRLRDHIRSLGYKAYMYLSDEARELGLEAGMLVVDDYVFFEERFGYLTGITVLNLWHGVGCKNVGKAVKDGLTHEDTMRRFLQFRRLFGEGMCFLATSPLMERHFEEQLLVRPDQIIRGGYPCNAGSPLKPSFDHSLIDKALPTPATKAVLYAPTNRDEGMAGFMDRALPDVGRLVQTLEEQDLLLVIKPHPLMSADSSYQAFMKSHKGERRLLFWDNTCDIYEVLDRFYAAIVDHGSFFYDLLARGMRRFVRYFFDLDDNAQQSALALDVRSMTCGTECADFEGLLSCLADLSPVPEDEATRLNDLFWAHGTVGDRKALVEAALSFEPDLTRPQSTLFSYDIFDTLISRTTLQQLGVFCYVKDKMETSGIRFPRHLVSEYELVRRHCEWDERDALELDEKRSSDEISLEGIFRRMKDIYRLSDEQVGLLQQWELEGELRALAPIEENVSEVQMLLNAHADVLLICDTYLPRTFVKRLLEKVDPRFAELPLYLSSDLGVRKTDGRLFMHVFHDIDFSYDSWVHKGDDEPTDSYKAFMLGIRNMWYRGGIEPSEYDLEFVEEVRSYDSYQVGRVLSRMAQDTAMRSDVERFAACYAPPLILPFAFWLASEAEQLGLDDLYLLASDGLILKDAVDIVVRECGLDVRTHLLLDSPLLWSLAAQADGVTDAFFSATGTLAQAQTLDAILAASQLDEGHFCEIVPELAHLCKQRALSPEDNRAVREALSRNATYRKHITKAGHALKSLVLDYLRQEIGPQGTCAFVQLIDRADLQESLTALLHDADLATQTTFLHAQSAQSDSASCVKRSYAAHNVHELLFVELLLQNTFEGRVSGYARTSDGRIEATLSDEDRLGDVTRALETYLPPVAVELAHIDYLDQDSALRDLFTFALDHMLKHAKDPLYLAGVAPLKEAGVAGNKAVDFAPEWTLQEVGQRMKGKMKLTGNRDMSLARSNIAYKAMFLGFQGMKAVGEFLELERNETAGEKALRLWRQSRQLYIQPAVERHNFGKVYPKAYLAEAKRKPLDRRKVIFLDVHEEKMPDAFELIWKMLERDYDFKLSYLTLDDNHTSERFRDLELHQRRLAIIKELADAAYIFLSDANDLVSCLPLREGTRVCQTWHACGAFKKWGMSTANLTFGRDRQGLLEHPYYKNLDLVTVSSPEVEWAYREAMVLEDTPEVVKPLGVSRTDVFFDPVFNEEARARIEAAVPAAAGKKLLLYAPTYRGSINHAEGPNKFDLPAMKAALGDEWVLLIKHHPFVHEREPIPDAVATFAFDVSDDLAIEDLLAVSDACITDYSSVVFEFCLHDRPMIFYPYDLGDYLNRRGFYYDYSEMTPGPIFFETAGIIDYLVHLDERFDVQAIRDFRQRFMRSCDGHATERILQEIFGDELSRHRKDTGAK